MFTRSLILIALFIGSPSFAAECTKSFAVKKSLLEHLRFDAIYTEKSSTLKEDLYYYEYIKFNFDIVSPTTKTIDLKLSDIRFMQRNCKFKSSSRKGGYNVLENARKIQEGKLRVEDLPAIRVWKDSLGRYWTLDHRRLAAYHLSGKVDAVTAQWVGKNLVMEQSNRDKFWPIEEGKRIDIIDYKNEKAIIIRI